MALRQLQVGRAEEMKLLVEIGEGFGAVIELRLPTRLLVQLYQRDPAPSQSAGERFPQIWCRPQNRLKTG